MDNSITESGMDFDSTNAIYIEKTELYKKVSNKTRSVDFIRVKDNNLLFVEAKTTFANPENPSSDNLIKYNNEIKNVCEKYLHSLSLLSAVMVGVKDATLDVEIILPSSLSIVFVLVIKNHEINWCKKITKEIKKNLPHYLMNIWTPIIFVINQHAAERYGLIHAKSS